MNSRLKLFLLISVSVTVRMVLLGDKSLWIDECLAWGATRLSWIEMFRSVSTGTPHPPLSFILMKLSTILAGNTEFGLRLLVSLATASAVIPVYRLAARRTTPRGGLFAAMLWAVSPFAVSLGQEAWVYGLNASLSLWFADTADIAWRGSKKAFAALFLLGAAGFLCQHIFVLSVAVSCVLYLSVPPTERISLKKFIWVPVVLALMYLPVFVYFLPQFAARSQRFARAGFAFGFQRLLSFQSLSAFFKLVAGGLLPDITRNLLDRPRMLTAYTVNGAVLFAAAVLPLFKAEKWNLPGLKWLWVAFLLPFALFLNDSPTIRHLAVLWIPLTITSAALFTRIKYSGVVVCLLCALALVPYYGIHEFPYHRSNWRTAVATVEEMAQPNDLVVVFGGKSTSLAWAFYSRSNLECYTPGGDNPFAGEEERTGTDPSEFLRGIVLSGSEQRIWVIADLWGVPSISAYTGNIVPSFISRTGESMEIGLIETSR